MNKDSSRVAAIRQLCCLGLGAQVLMPRLLARLRGLVPAESGGFFWIDGHGEMQNLYAERLLPPNLMVEFFHCHYDAGDRPFRPSFLARCQARESVTSTSADPLASSSSYYNEVMKPLDAHHVLYAIVRDAGGVVGQLSLYRPPGSPAFSVMDRATIGRVQHYIAHAAVSPAPAPGADTGYMDTEQDAMLLVGRDGSIVRASATARNLLQMATTVRLNRDTVTGVENQQTRQLLASLRRDLGNALQEQGRATPPQRVMDTPWGRFVLRAYAISEDSLRADSEVVVNILRQEPSLLRFADALEHFPISPQQREVALLLARGKSNPEIAESLGVSNNTASYHVKQLFAKLDAHSRREVIATVLRESP